MSAETRAPKCNKSAEMKKIEVQIIYMSRIHHMKVLIVRIIIKAGVMRRIKSLNSYNAVAGKVL